MICGVLLLNTITFIHPQANPVGVFIGYYKE